MLAMSILSFNLFITGCSVLSHEKAYHQTVECKGNKPVVRTFYGSDMDYLKVKQMENIDVDDDDIEEIQLEENKEKVTECKRK
jgi:hypothetical protein